MSATVETQAQIDKALAAGTDVIYIESPAGVWLTVNGSGSSHVVAWESSSVVAYGSSHVVARGSSSVVAWESSSVEARESSHVEARESSHVEAWESSSVEARESSSVVAWGSSHVVARGSSSVVAWGSSSVVARGSSSVVARESSHVEARGSSSVVASPLVAVHLHSGAAKVKGGVVIDVIGAAETLDAQRWCEFHGAKIARGRVTLYKAVDDEWRAGHAYTPTIYKPGTTVEASDWRDDNSCGGGLHVGPSPHHARDYYTAATRFVEVTAALKDIRPIPGRTAKVKARRVKVVREVDLWRDPIGGAS